MKGIILELMGNKIVVLDLKYMVGVIEITRQRITKIHRKENG